MDLPEGFQDVEDMTAEPAEPAPAVGDLPRLRQSDLTVTLPAGYLDARGQLHTVVKVKELTGVAEEALSRINMRDNMGGFVSTVLKFGVAEVGGKEATEDVLRSLVQGDRDTILLGIRRATYGDTLEKKLNCECGEESDVEIDLAKDVPIKKLDDPTLRVRPVKLRDGRVANVRIPDGHTSEELFSPAFAKKNSTELNTILLSLVVEDIDGDAVRADDVRNLGSQDRKTILSFLLSVQPGPQYGEVEVPCSTCHRTYPLEVDLADLLQG